MSPFILIYVTCPDLSCAQKLARSTVEAGLAACANIQERVLSIYPWEGEINEESEVVVVLKTQKRAWIEARDHIQSLHPYECPCILALPVEDLNSEYADWMSKNVRVK